MSAGIGAIVDTTGGGAAARRLGDAGLVTAAVGAAAVAARALSLPLSCPLLSVTGIPCPGCGMTRLADGVAHGHLLDALGTDPVGVLVLAAIGVLALVGVAGRAGARVSLPAATVRAVPLALAGALLVRWLGVLAGVGPVVT